MKIYNYFTNMVEENISQEIRLKSIDETRNYFLQKIKQNELMSRKRKEVCTTLNYIELFLLLASTITASLLGIPIGIPSFTLGLKICAIAAGIKKHKSIIKKKKKKHDKIVLLAKTKLNNIELLISKTLFDSNVSHNEFALIDNMLKEYDENITEYERRRNQEFKDLNSLSKT